MADDAWIKSAMLGIAMGVMSYFFADAPKWAAILTAGVFGNIGLTLFVVYDMPKRIREAIEP
jgi:hypothetical protein